MPQACHASARKVLTTLRRLKRWTGSSLQVPNPGCGHGYTGWVEIKPDNTLGALQYAVASGPQNSTGSFEIAFCKLCQPCPATYNASFDPGVNCTKCPKPPPPPPSPPPPAPPLADFPCIRFGHAIPVDNHVDVTITQDGDASITHTWSNYKFTDFSDWVNVFKPGTGTITVYENTGGKRGAQVYTQSKLPLTPGPLVGATGSRGRVGQGRAGPSQAGRARQAGLGMHQLLFAQHVAHYIGTNPRANSQLLPPCCEPADIWDL